jgi:transposase-like protein
LPLPRRRHHQTGKGLITQPENQRYRRKDCERKFDDLTGTIFLQATINP